MDTLLIESFITVPKYYFSCLVSIPLALLAAAIIVGCLTPLKKKHFKKASILSVFIFGLLALTSFLIPDAYSLIHLPQLVAELLVGQPVVRGDSTVATVNGVIFFVFFSIATMTQLLFEITLFSIKTDSSIHEEYLSQKHSKNSSPGRSKTAHGY